MPDYSEYLFKGKELQGFYIRCGTALFAVGFLFYKNLILAAFVALLSLPLKGVFQRYAAEKRREELTAQFRDLLYSLSASVSAGRQLQTAFGEAREQLYICYGGDALLYREVDYMVRSVEESHDSLDALLQDFAVRSKIPEVKQFVHICEICRKTGGNMEQVIGKTAEVLMQKIAARRELEMLTAQKRMEARLLTVMPIAMVLLLNLLSPDYLSALYEGVEGRLVMTAALAGIGLSAEITRRVTSIQV